MCWSLDIVAEHSTTFEPQMNGRIERWHRCLGDSVRCMLKFTDPRLWDLAGRHAAYIFNRLECGTGKLSAFQQRHNRSAWLDHLRRFGCLAYVKIPEHVKTPEPDGALGPRYEVGVYVGCSRENSSSLVSVWRCSRRIMGGFGFRVVGSKAVKYFEDHIIKNVDLLKYPDKFPLDASGRNDKAEMPVEGPAVPCSGSSKEAEPFKRCGGSEGF